MTTDVTITDLPPVDSVDSVTKHLLVSDIVKRFDMLGWFSPTIIKVKILMK